MTIVLAVPRPRSRVEKVAASGDWFKGLEHIKVNNTLIRSDVGTGLTTNVTHIPMLVPRIAPKITSQ